MSRWILAVAGTAALATACAQPAPDRDIDRDVDRDGPSLEVDDTPGGVLFEGNGFIEALGGRLDGSIGPATGLAGNAEYVNFYDDGFYTSADITVQGDSGTGMGIFSLNGSIANFEAGEGVRTCESDYDDPNSDLNQGGAAAFFTGCANSGTANDGWDYDAPAECTDIVVNEPGQDAPDGTMATVSILAHWSENGYGGVERTVKATLHLTEN